MANMMEMASQTDESTVEITRFELDRDTSSDTSNRKLGLSQFPDELILEVLSYLDVDDLLTASRVRYALSLRNILLPLPSYLAQINNTAN